MKSTMDAIAYDFHSGVAKIILNRPEAGNALDAGIAGELDSLCQRINGDPDIVTVILTGAGSSFCVGGELGDDLPFRSPAQSIGGLDRPVIAAINGDAIGQGLEIALCCDLRIASEAATFAMPQVTEGIIPRDGGTQRLARVAGRANALDLLLTGRRVDSREALRLGLVNMVVPSSELVSEVEALALSLAAKAPIAQRYLKEAVEKGLDLTLTQGLRLEADLYFLLHTTSDRTEGVRAFLEKRTPRFKGA